MSKKKRPSIAASEEFNRALLLFADVCERTGSEDKDLWQTAYTAVSDNLVKTIDLHVERLRK